ncbi:MAG TPA: GGDEF domain-containing protein, partial [Gammaproteobacteria bacterium]|nr:GGDEF domain-containing protein [Gammaproteobacteria bacterium]
MSTQLHHFADGAEIRVVSDTFHELSTLARRNAELEQANRQLELDVQRLERLVYLDPLTGLGNRRHFDVVIASELRRAARTSEPLTLLICDVDRFKECNDAYGHDAGDLVLIEIAGLLGRFHRRGADLAVRYGGDEFALLLPGVEIDAAQRLAAELLATVGTLRIRHPRAGCDARVTVSIGGATYEGAGFCSPTRLVGTADEALYRAKRAGRNRTEL